MTYARFQPGEPGGSIHENCLIMQFENGNWGDYSCAATSNYNICEKPTKPALATAVKQGKSVKNSIF